MCVTKCVCVCVCFDSILRLHQRQCTKLGNFNADAVFDCAHVLGLRLLFLL